MQTFADDEKLCPHGIPLVADGDRPQVCSTIGDTTACPRTHYCATKAGQSKGYCCSTKRTRRFFDSFIHQTLGYVCNLSSEKGSCAREDTRFHFDSSEGRCKQFMYSGCGGNENNFPAQSECEAFCAGQDGAGMTSTITDEKGNVVADLYNIGFSLSGPLLRAKHDESFNKYVPGFIIQ